MCGAAGMLTSDLAGEHVVVGLTVALHAQLCEDKGLELELSILLESYPFSMVTSRRMSRVWWHSSGKR